MNKNEHMFSEDDLKRLFGKDEEPLTVEFSPAPIPPTPQTQQIPVKHPTPQPATPPPPNILQPKSQLHPISPFSINSAEPKKNIPHLSDVRANYKEKHPILKLILKSLGVFLLVFFISFTIINWQALMTKIKYTVNNDYFDKTTETKNLVVKKTESRLVIPVIGVDAPIIWNVPEADIVKNLENGVAQYEDTALPGHVGNVFITGHSSYYVWANGSYKDVFALLNKLNNGDIIFVYYNGTKFTYKVESEKTVWPDDMTVLQQGNTNTLSLMTCVPIGTNLKRLIVTATQISTN